MRRALLFSILFCASVAAAQQPGTIPGTVSTGPFKIISPVTAPTISPGVLELLELEGRFSDAVEQGGGKVFSSWFADDAVTLNNGKPALLGRGAIAAAANWDPKSYQLSWIAQGAQMGPSNDMGFTWGQYTGKARSETGDPVVTHGRYITVWRKTADGWKVAMDASADDAPAAGDCCALPKP